MIANGMSVADCWSQTCTERKLARKRSVYNAQFGLLNKSNSDLSTFVKLALSLCAINSKLPPIFGNTFVPICNSTQAPGNNLNDDV